MPQMYPMSWLFIFISIESMLMVSFMLMSNEIMEGSIKIFSWNGLSVSKNFWLW